MLFWWRQQSTTKKILFWTAVLCLATGFTLGRLGIIVGVFLFIALVLIGLMLPNKPDDQAPEDKEWTELITPKVGEEDKKIRLFFNFLSLVFILAASYFLFEYLFVGNYAMALICAFVLLAAFSSWVYLQPKLYNEIFTRMKIVPLKRKMTTMELFNKVGVITTPFGTPLLSRIPNIKEPVAVYRIIDFNWIVYFYIRGDDILIQAENLDPNGDNVLTETDWVLMFTQQLADLFSYMQNTGETPDADTIARIFKLPYQKQ